MSGPIPKPASMRARRNKTSTSSRLETVEEPIARAPSLGRHPVEGRKWDRRTRAWWREVWASPMAEEFLRADIDGLFMLATLVDEFWRDPNPKLAAEIRLQRQCYGLTPIDRRRLQWEVVRAEQAERRRPAPAPERANSDAHAEDPRSVLRAI